MRACLIHDIGLKWFVLRPAGILRRSTSVMSDGSGEVPMTPLGDTNGKQRRARALYFIYLSIYVYI